MKIEMPTDANPVTVVEGDCLSHGCITSNQV